MIGANLVGISNSTPACAQFTDCSEQPAVPDFVEEPSEIFIIFSDAQHDGRVTGCANDCDVLQDVQGALRKELSVFGFGP